MGLTLEEVVAEDDKLIAHIAEIGYNTQTPWSEVAAAMKRRADIWYSRVLWDEKLKAWRLREEI